MDAGRRSRRGGRWAALLAALLLSLAALLIALRERGTFRAEPDSEWSGAIAGGIQVALAGDVDGDGARDLVVRVQHAGHAPGTRQAIRVFDLSGRPLGEHTTDLFARSWRRPCAGVVDADGDGDDDFALLSWDRIEIFDAPAGALGWPLRSFSIAPGSVSEVRALANGELALLHGDHGSSRSLSELTERASSEWDPGRDWYERQGYGQLVLDEGSARYGKLCGWTLSVWPVARGPATASLALARPEVERGELQNPRLLSSPGDLDGDGVADWAVRAGHRYYGETTDRAWIFSGSTGALLREGAACDRLVGDVDGDGLRDGLTFEIDRDSDGDAAHRPWLACEDVARGSRRWKRALESTDGSVPRPWGEFRWSALALEDQDGDGHDDLLVALAWSWREGPAAAIWILSGASGDVVRAFDLDGDEVTRVHWADG